MSIGATHQTKLGQIKEVRAFIFVFNSSGTGEFLAQGIELFHQFINRFYH